MDVILLEKIHKLGDLGEQVKVKSGFGRNFLIPSGKAVSATPENIAKFEATRADLERQQQESLVVANERAEKLNNLSVSIKRKAGAEGKLYGSIGTVDIVDAITEQEDVELVKQEIRMPDGPIRNLGEYELTVQLHADVSTQIMVNVISEEES
ncbi:MAG: 50S ribosomal protein L9 [Legionellales bacterium]|nr:50S ribosomal protein L9 [Legionellales bacterium]|tara:strand:- start:1037 stop:1495 length:459 start_codon:yes stop_codon:yes gene_type:complete